MELLEGFFWGLLTGAVGGIAVWWFDVSKLKKNVALEAARSALAINETQKLQAENALLKSADYRSEITGRFLVEVLSRLGPEVKTALEHPTPPASQLDRVEND